jgi:hypothetical protein
MVSVAGARCGKGVRFMPAIVAASPSTRQQRDNTPIAKSSVAEVLHTLSNGYVFRGQGHRSNDIIWCYGRRNWRRRIATIRPLRPRTQ